jgi:hypothetical protein
VEPSAHAGGANISVRPASCPCQADTSAPAVREFVDAGSVPRSNSSQLDGRSIMKSST